MFPDCVTQSSQSYAERVPAQSYVSDNAENLTTVRSHGVSYLPSMNQLGPSNYFVYDGEGNPTDFNGNAATFDEESRMTSLGSSFSAVYRADGMRAWKSTNTGKVSYIYDQFGYPVLETANNQVTAINSFGANGLTSRRSGGSSTFYTFDAFGNTSQRLDSNGAVLSTHACDEYGMVQSTPSAPNDPFYGYGAQFGNYLDTSTGLYLMGHRYYDAYYARFVNTDPIGLAGGANEYGYAYGNPSVSVDPSGLNGADATLARDGYDYGGNYVGQPMSAEDEAQQAYWDKLDAWYYNYELRRSHAAGDFVTGLMLGGMSSAAEAGAAEAAEEEPPVPPEPELPSGAPFNGAATGDLDAGLAASRQAYRGGALTAAARALDKHVSRDTGFWPIPTGNAAAKNLLADNTIRKILENPLSQVVNNGPNWDCYAPSGHGVRFWTNGGLFGLMDPDTPGVGHP